MVCEVTVRLFHLLRELTGAGKLHLRPEQPTLPALIESFVKEYPQAAEELLDEDGHVSYRYMITVNGLVFPAGERETAELSDGDEVAFLTMVTGG